MRSRRTIILVVLAVFLAVLLSVFSHVENWKRDLTENSARLDPKSDDPMLRPVTLAVAPQDVAGAIVQWAELQPRWSVQSRTRGEAEITIHLTHRTRLFRFIDDIHVRLVPAGEATRVEAESRSRIGKGDLGQNPRNLRELTNALVEHR